MVNTSLFLTGILALASSLPLAFAHGAGDSHAELVARNAMIENSRRSLEACQSKLKSRDLENRRAEKRDAFVKRFLEQEENQKVRRQAATTSTAALPTATDPFNGVIPTCVLAPQEEIGPYCVDVSGELVRDDIRETQPGVNMLLDVQVFDVDTCEVLPNVMLDFWHCNSTGKYSGFAAEGTTGLTFLRGLSVSDSDGISQVITKFPGHYGGRATHVHIIAHLGGTIGSTYTGGTIPHIGQIFFPQTTISAIEALSPYNTNTAAITLNTADRVYTQQASVTSGYTDIVTIKQLGTNISAGVLASISLGIKKTASYSTGSGSGGGPAR